MPKQNPQRHIKLDGFVRILDYTYPKTPFGKGLELAERNRNQHGNRILNQLNAIRQQFDIPLDVELADGIVRDDAVYVDFISDWGYQLYCKNMDQDKNDPLFQILNIREEIEGIEEPLRFRYHVTMMMTRGGIGQFIEKINLYLTNNIVYRGEDTGNP